MNPWAIVDIILGVLLIAAIVVALVLYKKQAKCIKGAISKLTVINYILLLIGLVISTMITGI